MAGEFSLLPPGGAATETAEAGGRTVPCLTVQPPESRMRVGSGPRSGTAAAAAAEDETAATADGTACAAVAAASLDFAVVPAFFRGRLAVVVFLDGAFLARRQRLPKNELAIDCVFWWRRKDDS